MGAYSTALLKQLVQIPVYPLKGYSITVPIVNADAAPVSTILDETYKIAVTRFDDRIRVGGMSIEGGARAGLVAPDEKAFEWLKGRPKAPKGAA